MEIRWKCQNPSSSSGEIEEIEKQIREEVEQKIEKAIKKESEGESGVDWRKNKSDPRKKERYYRKGVLQHMALLGFESLVSLYGMSCRQNVILLSRILNCATDECVFPHRTLSRRISVGVHRDERRCDKARRSFERQK